MSGENPSSGSAPSKGNNEKGGPDAAKVAAVIGVVLAGGIAISYLNSRKGRNQAEDFADDAGDTLDDFGNKAKGKFREGQRWAGRKGDEAKWGAEDADWQGRRAGDRVAGKANEIGGAARNAAEETKGFFQRAKDDLTDSAKDTGNKIKGKSREVGDSAKRATRTHRVQKGDTLYSLSKRYNVTVDSIKRTNNLFGSEVHPGDELYMP